MIRVGRSLGDRRADRTEEMAERRWTTSLLALIGIVATLTSCDTVPWQEEKVSAFTQLMFFFLNHFKQFLTSF